MDEEKLGLFEGEDKPDVKTAWLYYQRGIDFNNQINLEDTVRSNRNFYIGKQWEGVQANGLPTPVFNVLKRVTGFIVASNTTDNLKVNVTSMTNAPGQDQSQEIVRIVGNEFDALMERNRVPALVRRFCRNAAVDGDGCMYTYWDPDVDCGNGIMGAIKTEIVDNTRVYFGNPNSSDVQGQPYIQIANREIARRVKKRAKANGSPDWQAIHPDTDDNQVEDEAKYTDDKVTVILTLWRDEETGEIWAYESTQNAEVKKPTNLGIRMYPICWLSWDMVASSYHGQAMITGLIPNQIFINKVWAMSMLSIMRGAWPKIIYDKTRVAKWDNRVGGAIAINGGDVNSVAKVLDPAPIDPQVAQFISLAVSETEETLGATQAALGQGKAYNTSAILSLQKAAATPTELTRQNLYEAVEDLFHIYKEFMGEFYGTRPVDMEVPVQALDPMLGQPATQVVPMPYDFSVVKDNPMLLKLDVGASSYYSEIAAMQTLDSAVQGGLITFQQYLERIPDSYFPKRRALLNELKNQTAPATPPTAPTGGGVSFGPQQEPEITGGRGYGAAQRAVNANL